MIAFHENKNKLVVECFNIFNEEKKLIRLYETSSGKFWNYSACESTGFHIETLNNAHCKTTGDCRGEERGGVDTP